MRFRGTSIRRKIVVLLLVPLVSLVSIWVFATYLTAREAQQLIGVTNAAEKVGNPTEDAVQAIQQERRLILIYLADPRRSDALSNLHQQQRTTDTTVEEVREHGNDEGIRSDLSTVALGHLDTLLDGISGLENLREKVEDNTVTKGEAFEAYNDLIDPCHEFLSAMHGLNDVELEKQGRAYAGLSRAREYLAREDALMAAALTSGQMTRADMRSFADRVAERETAYEINLAVLPAEDRQIHESYWESTEGRTLTGYENDVITSGPRGALRTIDRKRWDDAASTTLADLQRLSEEARERYDERVEPSATNVLVKAGAAGVLGLLAVVGSVVVSFKVGRGLVRDLNTLRKEAHEASGVRLPNVMRRLASGEQVDVEAEAPRLEYSQDEMGQVGQAVNTLQRAAVEAAVKQADMRRGVSEVFVNLARRNQVLLHRQLTLLDTMERRTEDSDELADLFRLDHLTTRMRRHAEGLVILSGAAPSRQWRKPVQLMDVVRAAVSEVEDYERIEVRRLPQLAVDGGAVADLTHLIAELLENATVFSPPHTGVQVLGERVVNGFTLEIHDRGLGMVPEALLDANLRLAETPEFELSDTDRLGLFVVSRLAQRQGVRVSLQTSPYGGTTAVVLIPGSVLTETQGGDDERRSAVGGRSGASGEGDLSAMGPGSRRDALTKAPVLESGSPERRALDGPVELEPPVGEFDDDPPGEGHTDEARPPAEEEAAGRTSRGLPRRRPGRSRSGSSSGPAPTPASEQHQQAETGEDDEASRPATLPRRPRGTPVLVSDHGRPVEGAGGPCRSTPSSEPPPSEGGHTDGDHTGATDPTGSLDSTGSGASGGPPDPADRRPSAGGSAEGGDGAGQPRPADDFPERAGTRSTASGGAAGERAPSGPTPSTTGPTTVGGLPRRVRQASLAPQLRSEGSEDDAAGGRASQEPRNSQDSAETAERDAEAVRTRMASLQSGWQRGRRENAAPRGDRPPEQRDSGDPVQGTTPEGDGR